MHAPNGHPLLGAHVGGFAAFVLAAVLAEHLPARMVSLQRLVEQGRVDPARLAEVAATWRQIRAAAEVWSTWRASADGSAEDLAAEMPSESSQEIDTATAAALLRVTESRVRQLARAGHIDARRVGRTWLLSRSACELRREAA